MKKDIDAFVVVAGPGSFTGLRVGLAAVKALAEILQKPIVPVSLLEVLARYGHMIAGGNDSVPPVTFRYAVALDAGRKEAFVGQYEIVIASKTMPDGRAPSPSTATAWRSSPVAEPASAGRRSIAGPSCGPSSKSADFAPARR